MHIFKKGDPDYHELLNSNFDELKASNDELVTTVSGVSSSLGNYAKKTDVSAEIKEATTTVYQRSMQIGYGVNATFTRIGNVVNVSINSNQTSSRPDGLNSLTETVPNGFRPLVSQAVSAQAYVASDLNVDRFMMMIFGTSGSISSRSKNMSSGSITIALSATWLTSDAIPK